MVVRLTHLPVVITLNPNLTKAEIAGYNNTQYGASIEPGQGRAVGFSLIPKTSDTFFSIPRRPGLGPPSLPSTEHMKMLLWEKRGLVVNLTARNCNSTCAYVLMTFSTTACSLQFLNFKWRDSSLGPNNCKKRLF